MGEGSGSFGAVEFPVKVVEKGFCQRDQRDGVIAAQAFAHPIREKEKSFEGGISFPNEGQGLLKAAAVGEQIPKASKPSQAVERFKRQMLGSQNFVRGMRIVDHLEGCIVARDGSASQPFEDAHLDLLGFEGEQAVESGAEALERFPGQPGNQVRMDVNASGGSKRAQVVFEFRVVLAAADEGCSFLAKSLDAHLQLDRPGGETTQQTDEFLRQPIGYHLEVEEQAVDPAIEEELEDGAARFEGEIEGAIHELEGAGTALQEGIEGGEEAIEVDGANGDIERGEAKFAGERASAGRLHIEDAVGEVFRGVGVVGQDQLIEFWEGGVQDFGEVASTREHGTANLGKKKIGFASDDQIGLLDDGLKFRLMAHLGAAEDQEEVGCESFEDGDEFGAGGSVPDVNAEPDDFWGVRQNFGGDVEGALFDFELEDPGVGLEFAEVGVEVAEPKSGVDVARVEGGEEDGGWGGRGALGHGGWSVSAKAVGLQWLSG